MRFARNVEFHIKQGKQDELSKVLHNEVLPLLKKQAGFHTELALVNDRQARAISVWNDRSSAEQYGTSTFPKVMDKVQPYIDGTPNVQMYEVAATTLI